MRDQIKKITDKILKFLLDAFIVLFVASFVKSTIFGINDISSGSMLPTLLIGDWVVVDKMSYGIKKPFTEYSEEGSKYFYRTKNPQRGDIIVFKSESGQNFVKRIIGIPGDMIKYENKVLYVNGQEYLKEKINDKEIFNEIQDKFLEQELVAYSENGYTTFNAEKKNSHLFETLVPEGEYFVMGDNRDFSHDSRYFGFVPFEKINGKAKFIFISWQWPWKGHQAKENKIRPSRFGKRLR